MSDLVVIVYPNEEKAEEVRNRLFKLQGEYLIKIGDAVIATRTDSGQVKLNQLMNMTAAGAASGSMWGLLVGVLFLNPLIGVAAGAASGALAGALTDTGINDPFMKAVSRPGREPSHRRAGAVFGLPLGTSRRRHRQARDGAHAQAQLRHASSGERHRYPHHPGAAWPQQSFEHGALHQGLERPDPAHDEPARPAEHRGGAAGLIRSAHVGETGGGGYLPPPWRGVSAGSMIGHLGRVERRVMSAIELCRTAALGGHVEGCRSCGAIRVAYNSCRNRHCPKCQGQARAGLAGRAAGRAAAGCPTSTWCSPCRRRSPRSPSRTRRSSTPSCSGRRPRRCASIAADPKHLGAEIGLVAVLHSWGQNLHHHPHLHCIVPGGGPSPDGTRWISCRPGFFLPVRVLSRLFRRLFLEELRAAFEAGRLELLRRSRRPWPSPPPSPACWPSSAASNGSSTPSRPSAGRKQVLAYLGRYTHRVAIANSRLISMDDDRVAFRWKDYRHGGRTKIMTLDAHEFIRRFLLHTCRTASIASATTASSPTVIAPPSSTCAAACWPTRNRTISNRMPKARRRRTPRVSASLPMLWRTDDHARHLAVRTGAAEPFLERHLMIAPSVSSSLCPASVTMGAGHANSWPIAEGWKQPGW